jgi:hypothetical protein
MTIATSTSAAIGHGNGFTTVFPYTFLIPTDADLVVKYIDLAGVVTTLVPSQYTALGIGNPAGGTVAYPLAGSPIPVGSTLIIQRVVPYTQPTRLLGQGGYFPQVVESALDNLEMQIQQAVGAIGTGIHYPAVDINPISELAPAAARAGKFFAFDGNGNPAMLMGNLLAGDLLPYTLAGAAFNNTYKSANNLVGMDAGWYVTYTSALADIIYGFASNVYRSAGVPPQHTVGGQFSGWAMSGVSSATWGVVSQAIGQSGSSGNLVAAEFTAANLAHNNVAAKVGLNLVWKDRGDGVATVGDGLGLNKYNLGAIGLWLTSQVRSTAGELCGWRRGISFDEYSLDADLNDGAIGIDFAKVHYYGGSDPLTAYRMTAAIRLRDFQSILWNGDPTLANDKTEPTNAIRTTFDSIKSRWILTNTGAEKFGIDVTTGALWINGLLATGVTLAGNNLWTGTNTFNGPVVIGSTFTLSGVSRRIVGDFTNATVANRTLIQTSTVNGATFVGVIPNGTGLITALDLMSSATATNCQVAHVSIDNTQFAIQSAGIGTFAYVPMTFAASSTEGMRLNTSNQLLIGTTTAAISGALLRVNGMVQIDNICAFSVHNNGVTQSILTSTYTKLTFSTKDFDQNTSFNTSTSSFTPPAGKYILAACVQYLNPTNNARYSTIFYKNGVALKNNNIIAPSVKPCGTSFITIVDANGTDFFEVWVWQDGSTVTVSGATTDTWFVGARLG